MSDRKLNDSGGTNSISGGNDPAIVFPDVDIDKVAEKVAFYAFLNSGQVGTSSSRDCSPNEARSA